MGYERKMVGVDGWGDPGIYGLWSAGRLGDAWTIKKRRDLRKETLSKNGRKVTKNKVIRKQEYVKWEKESSCARENSICLEFECFIYYCHVIFILFEINKHNHTVRLVLCLLCPEKRYI